MSGMAIHNISPVKREFVQPTLENFQKKILDPIGVDSDTWILIGSTGKKDESGDLDIGFDIGKAAQSVGLSEDELVSKMLDFAELNGWQFNNRIKMAGKMVHFGVPIIGETDGKIAQLDIMTTKSLEWTAFKYFAPGQGESHYKGAARGNLMQAMIKELTIKGEALHENDQIPYINEEGIEYPGTTFSYISFNDDGIWKIYKTFIGKKGLLKNAKKLTDMSKFIGSTPSDFIIPIFGENSGYTKDSFNTFESIWKMIFDDSIVKDDKMRDKIVLSFARITINNLQELPDVVDLYCEDRGISYEDAKDGE